MAQFSGPRTDHEGNAGSAAQAVDISLHLDTYASNAAVRSHLLSFAQNGLGSTGGGAGTFTAAALNAARTQMLSEANGARSLGLLVPRVVVMLLAHTHLGLDCGGGQSCEDPAAEAELLRKEGVTVIVVAIGSVGGGVHIEAQKIASPEHIVLLETFDELIDLSTVAQVVSKSCDAPALLTPGTPINGTVQRCEYKAFISPCPVSRYVTRVETSSGAESLSLYTARAGSAGPVNFVQAATDVSGARLLQTTADNDDIDMRVSVVGGSVGGTHFSLDSWFDRYSGYVGEVVEGSKVTAAFVDGEPLYQCPNDGNRDMYYITHDTTGAQLAIKKQAGVVRVRGSDVSGPGGARIRVEHPTLQCYVSFIDIRIETVEVSGQIYVDYDGSGHQERGESGVGGIVVSLQNRRQGKQNVITATTNSLGYWHAAVSFGNTRLRIDVGALKLQVTEGFADYVVDVTAQSSAFPKVGVRALTTSSTTSSSTSTVVTTVERTTPSLTTTATLSAETPNNRLPAPTTAPNPEHRLQSSTAPSTAETVAAMTTTTGGVAATTT